MILVTCKSVTLTGCLPCSRLTAEGRCVIVKYDRQVINPGVSLTAPPAPLYGAHPSPSETGTNGRSGQCFVFTFLSCFISFVASIKGCAVKSKEEYLFFFARVSVLSC